LSNCLKESCVSLPSVRRIRPDEGPAFRAIRLEAIAESPTAFGSTLAEIEGRPAHYWDERARTGAAGDENVLVVADEGGRWVGIAGGFLVESADARTADLVSMWVHPAHRGRQVGRRLVEHVATWARDRRARHLVLWVTEGNDTAITLYARCGFIVTGATQPLPSHPNLREQEMVLDLG
jgi:GNAT superfamily N-acetyltransferase